LSGKIFDHRCDVPHSFVEYSDLIGSSSNIVFLWRVGPVKYRAFERFVFLHGGVFRVFYFIKPRS